MALSLSLTDSYISLHSPFNWDLYVQQVKDQEKQPAFAFGIKHSPYTYTGKVLH
jgi:hypothetical protein